MKNSELYRTQRNAGAERDHRQLRRYTGQGEATEEALAVATEQATATINLMLDTQQNGITPEGSLDILDATLDDGQGRGSRHRSIRRC